MCMRTLPACYKRKKGDIAAQYVSGTCTCKAFVLGGKKSHSQSREQFHRLRWTNRQANWVVAVLAAPIWRSNLERFAPAHECNGISDIGAGFPYGFPCGVPCRVPSGFRSWKPFGSSMLVSRQDMRGSLPQLSLSLWHLLDKQNEGSFTPGTFPPSGKVTSIPTFAYQVQCYAVVQQMVNR
jgi:hypothetical protein